MNLLQKILCVLGGANLTILEKCPNDKNKFIATGIGVLNTSFLSMFTMGYAIHCIASGLPLWLIILFSIFWGFIIFGIDWGLITTMHKKKQYYWSSRKSPGDGGSGWSLVGTTVFRLCVAIAISWTVSKPLEVLVFEDYLPTARNEMRDDYQKRLNSSYVDKENTARLHLTNVEDELKSLSLKKQQIAKDDPLLTRLTDELKILKSQYDDQKIHAEELNTKSAEKVHAAQGSINSIQGNIDRIANTSTNLSTSQQEQVSHLKASQQPYISTRDFENGEIRKRNKELSTMLSAITAKQGEINDRYSAIDTEVNNTRTILSQQLTEAQAYNQAISEEAAEKKSDNATVAKAFEKDNLINNIIAIGYLEKGRYDPDASIEEREIAHKVYYTSWLLMIVIMLVDTAPIVIKLLSKRGDYEEEKEKMAFMTRITCEADKCAYSSTYNNYAATKLQHTTVIDEIQMTYNTLIASFNIILEMKTEAMNKIRNIIGISTNSTIEQELSAAFDSAYKKCLDLFSRFINTQ